MADAVTTLGAPGTAAPAAPAAGTPPGTAPAAPAAAPAAPVAALPAAVAGVPVFTWDPSLRPEVKDLLVAKAFDKNPNALATSYFEANKALSGAKDVIALPDDKAPKEAWDKFYTSLGRPEKAGDYEFTFPQGAAVDEPFVNFGKEFFHELGVPKAKAQGAIDKWQGFVVKRMGEMAESSRQANEAEIAALETSLGKDKFNKTVADGQVAFKALNLPKEVASRVEASIGASAMMQLFAALGAKIPQGEGIVVGNQPTGVPVDPSQMSLEQLNEHMKTLEADKDHMDAYLKKEHPKHDEAVKRMLRIEDLRVERRKAAGVR